MPSMEQHPSQWQALGLDFESPMSGRFNITWDPIGENDVDLGFIGAGRKGVWLKVHPMIALAHAPDLQWAVARYEAGIHELGSNDYDTVCSKDFLATRILLEARARQVERIEMMRRRDRGGSQSGD